MNEQHKKEMLAEFVRFLKERGAFTIYVRYVNETYGYYRFFERYVNIANANTNAKAICRGLIINAFSWNKTKEGHEFWFNLHNEWINFVDMKYPKYE